MLFVSRSAVKGYVTQCGPDSGLDVWTKFPCNMHLGRDTRIRCFGCRLRHDLQNETSAEHSVCNRDVIRRANLESATFVCSSILAAAGLVAALWRNGSGHVEC